MKFTFIDTFIFWFIRIIYNVFFKKALIAIFIASIFVGGLSKNPTKIETKMNINLLTNFFLGMLTPIPCKSSLKIIVKYTNAFSLE